MEYLVLLTRRGEISPSWRAAVPTLPECVVDAPTRKEAIERIRERIAEIAAHTEVLRVQVAASPKGNGDFGPTQFDLAWTGFGVFRGDLNWGELFDTIETERDALQIGG